LERLGGEIKLDAEVTEILVKDRQAYGARTKDGAEYYVFLHNGLGFERQA
jgi:phytoene dehydrogenase-like protein